MPQTHKLAIYIPFMLPVCLPVVSKAVAFAKQWRGARQRQLAAAATEGPQ